MARFSKAAANLEALLLDLSIHPTVGQILTNAFALERVGAGKSPSDRAVALLTRAVDGQLERDPSCGAYVKETEFCIHRDGVTVGWEENPTSGEVTAWVLDAEENSQTPSWAKQWGWN